MLNSTKIKQLQLGSEVYDHQVRGLSIRRNKNCTSWYYKYYDKNSKKQIRKTLGRFPKLDLKQARIMAITFTEDKDSGYLDSAFKEYLQHKKDTGARQVTINNYNSIYSLYVEDFAHKKLRDINRYEIKRLHDKITKNSIYQANRTISLVRAVYNYMIDTYEECADLINPASRIKLNTEKSRDKYLNDSELPKFVTEVYREYVAVKSNASLAILIALTTGARKSDILSIEYDELDFDSGLWTIPEEKSKNRKAVKIYVHPFILGIIKGHFKDSKYLFKANTISGHQEDIQKSINTLCKNVDLKKVSMHVFRHTFVTVAYSSNVNTLTVSAMVGHTPSGITGKVYGHVPDDQLRAGFTVVGERVLNNL